MDVSEREGEWKQEHNIMLLSFAKMIDWQAVVSRETVFIVVYLQTV